MITTRPMNSMLDRMVTLSRAMDDAFLTNGSRGASRWAPALDAWETEQAFHVALDLPGVNADQVEIGFEQNTLTITGKREPRAKLDEAQPRFVIAERTGGTFTRSLRFPQYVESGKISAQFDRGVLTVTIPKAEAAKPRKIAINTPAGATT